MKNNLLKLVFVVACLGFMFSGCVKDTTEVETVAELPFSSRFVSLDEIPEIADYMNKNIYGFALRSASNEGEPVYDEKNIIETTEKDGNVNYIISFLNDDNPVNEFNNLIISGAEGGKRKSFIAKYICNLDSYDNFTRNKFNFKYFNGVAEFTVVDEGLNKQSNPCDPVTVPFGTNIPLNTDNNSLNNGATVGNTNNSTIYNLTLNGSQYYSYTIYWNSAYSSSSSSTSNSTPLLAWPELHYHLVNRTQPSTTSTSNPCPEPLPEGFVAPNISQIAINALKSSLNLTPPQWRWFAMAGNNDKFLPFYNAYFNEDYPNTSERKAFFVDLLKTLRESVDQTDAIPLIGLTTTTFDSRNNIFLDSFEIQIDPYLDMNFSNPPITPHLFGLHYFINVQKLKSINPEWNYAKCFYEAGKPYIHLSLDAFGLIPVVGEVADLVNGALYAVEGDGLNATLSLASAIPIVGYGSTASKYAIKIKTAYASSNKVKLVWKVLPGNIVYFGTDATCRKQLRKALNMVVGNLNQAHHIIPISLQSNIIVQKAFKSSEAFHLNEALNGISLSTLVHNGSHSNYNNQVLGYLNQLSLNASPAECYNKVNEIITKVRIAVANNPNTPINQLTF